MDIWINIIKDFGFPIFMVIWLLKYMKDKDILWNQSIESVNQSINKLSDKITNVLTAMVQYKRGDTSGGDFYVGNILCIDKDEKTNKKKTKKEGGNNDE